MKNWVFWLMVVSFGVMTYNCYTVNTRLQEYQESYESLLRIYKGDMARYNEVTEEAIDLAGKIHWKLDSCRKGLY